MPRPRKVGMPRAKKKKPEQQQAAGPSTSAPAPAEDTLPSPLRAPKPVARQALASLPDPSSDSLYACGAQARIKALLIYINHKELSAHLSFNVFFEGVLQ